MPAKYNKNKGQREGDGDGGSGVKRGLVYCS